MFKIFKKQEDGKLIEVIDHYIWHDGQEDHTMIPYGNFAIWDDEECKKWGLYKVVYPEPPEGHTVVEYTLKKTKKGRYMAVGSFEPIPEPEPEPELPICILKQQFVLGLVRKGILDIKDVIEHEVKERIIALLLNSFRQEVPEEELYILLTEWAGNGDKIYENTKIVKHILYTYDEEEIKKFFEFCSAITI